MPEVSIDDANKVIIAEIERRGTLNSESKLPNPDVGKIKECEKIRHSSCFPLECALVCMNKDLISL